MIEGFLNVSGGRGLIIQILMLVTNMYTSKSIQISTLINEGHNVSILGAIDSFTLS